jgi:hypothetical protein
MTSRKFSPEKPDEVYERSISTIFLTRIDLLKILLLHAETGAFLK